MRNIAVLSKETLFYLSKPPFTYRFYAMLLDREKHPISDRLESNLFELNCICKRSLQDSTTLPDVAALFNAIKEQHPKIEIRSN